MSLKTKEILQYTLGVAALVTIATTAALQIDIGAVAYSVLGTLAGALIVKRPTDQKALA